MNCCVLAYFLDTADLPVISQVMSSAKMLVMYPAPSAQERNASATISRLDLLAHLTLPAEADSRRCQAKRHEHASPAPRPAAGRQVSAEMSGGRGPQACHS
jgi:hypothetical protein